MGSVVCPACRAEAPEGTEACPACGERIGADGAAADGVVTASAAATEFPAAGAWRRFFARSFDVSIEMIVIWILFVIVIGVASVAAHRDLWPFREDTPVGDWAAALVLLPIALLLDASICRIFGNTPGKTMLGVVVRDARGERLNFKRYLGRNMRVWLVGYGLGIPLVSLITMAWQGIRLEGKKPASYDVVPGHRVLAKPISAWRKSGFGSVYVALLVLCVAGPMFASKYGKVQQVEAPHVVSAWKNPVTGRSVSIGTGWQYAVEKTETGGTLYEFGHASRKAIVIVHVDIVASMTLAQYVGAFTENIKRIIRLSSDGQFLSDHGDEAWSGTGTLTGAHPDAWSAKVIKVGTSYWAIESLQEAPASTGSDVEKLESALWATIQ